MKTLVLGGGFGGIVAAHSLRRALADEHEVTLISRDSDFYLRAAFPRLAFENSTSRADIRLRLDEALPARGIRFQQATVTSIRPGDSVVETSGGELRYDYLIVALGTRYADDAVPGLREHGHSLWTVDAAERLHERLERFERGSFVTGAAPGSPCEGPTWEAVLHLDRRLREHGLRDQVEIHLFSTKPKILQPAGPAGQAWAHETFTTLGIQMHTDAELVELKADRAIFRDGRQIPADVALVMAPYEGHDLVKQAGLGDRAGFIPVDSGMRSRSHSNLFAIGDAVSMPQQPKMAHNAMRGARVAAANIAAEVARQPASGTFAYELMCVVDNGGARGTYLKSDTPWGGTLSVVMGAHSANPGLAPEEAHFIKKAFGDHFLGTGGDVRYIM